MAQVRSPEDRWAWVEVDLGAVKRNVRSLKKCLGRGVKLMCAVKADAYGHGAVACTKAMFQAGADQFAVATVAEGVELREAGITWPILMLNECPIDSIDTLVAYDIMPSLYTFDFGLAYGERAAAAGKVGKYHLAIDSGMNRIGVLPVDVVDFRHGLDFHRGLECAGTFTHFATADEVDGWDFQLQANRFVEAVTAIHNAGMETGLVHCDNTPGMILHPRAQFDMCRAGIGLYGLHPADSTRGIIHLEPAMSVRGRVTRVVRPPVGAGVSYGMQYRVPKQGVQIATVPIGYADGLARVLSNNMDVIINGVRARQAGRICMDQFMVAVEPDGPRGYRPNRPVEVGDVVTVLGRDGDEEITADEMAKLRNTINYEVTCNFGMRLEKIYV